jgi:monothiol glutaredoxin
MTPVPPRIRAQNPQERAMSSFKNIFKVVGADQAAQPAVQAQGDAMERIRQDIGSNKIMVYMKGTPEMPQCGFSAQTVQVLNELGVPYAYRNVLEDPELRQAIKEFSNWPTIPQVYVNGKFIGGCDIVTEMAERGELSELVK